MSKQRSGYSKKRNFSGNQFTVNSKRLKTSETSTASTSEENVPESTSEDQAANTCISASARKIGLVDKESALLTSEYQLSGYRIIDVDILGNVFKSMPCKVCLECQLELVEDDTKRMGSASFLSLHCSSCGHSEEFYTSKKVGYCFEVNRRMIYGMRSIDLIVAYLGCKDYAQQWTCPNLLIRGLIVTTQKPSCVLPGMLLNQP